MATKFSQFIDGAVYTKHGSNYVLVDDLNNIPNNSLIYIRHGNQVATYKVSNLLPISPLNVGFNITNPWAGNGTQKQIDNLITASKKLGKQIDIGIKKAEEAIKAEEKKWRSFVVGHFLITLVAMAAVVGAAELYPAATASTGTATGASSALSTGTQYVGIAGAPNAVGAPATSFLGMGGGGVIPSAGTGVGIVTSQGATILPSATTAVSASSGASLLSKVGSVLGINSPAQAAVKGATLAGKVLISQQKAKELQNAMTQYAELMAAKRAQDAAILKQQYEQQLEQLANQLQQQPDGSYTWGATNNNLDLSKYMPYIIIGVVGLLLVVSMKK